MKSGIVGLTLDSAVSAEAKRGKALAVVELEDGCGGRRHGVRYVCEESEGDGSGNTAAIILRSRRCFADDVVKYPAPQSHARECTFLIELGLFLLYLPPLIHFAQPLPLAK